MCPRNFFLLSLFSHDVVSFSFLIHLRATLFTNPRSADIYLLILIPCEIVINLLYDSKRVPVSQSQNLFASPLSLALQLLVMMQWHHTYSVDTIKES